MKYLYIIISLLILLFSCTKEETLLVINNENQNLQVDSQYKMELRRSSFMSYPFSSSIDWRLYGKQGFQEYQIYFSDQVLQFTNIFDTLYIFEDMYPGEFRDIYVQVITDNDSYLDSIQIFSRPIIPVYNFDYYVELIQDTIQPKYYRNLSWSKTLESEQLFQKYNIYKSSNISDLLSLNSCSCLLDSASYLDTVYIDTSSYSNPDILSHYYLIETVLNDSYSRNSFIPNASFPEIEALDLNSENISDDYTGFIELKWEPLTENLEYFYQYEIWRSETQSLSDTLLLAMIDNLEHNNFKDTYNIGSGKSWYYSIAIVDKSGKKYFSEFVLGRTRP